MSWRDYLYGCIAAEIAIEQTVRDCFCVDATDNDPASTNQFI